MYSMRFILKQRLLVKHGEGYDPAKTMPCYDPEAKHLFKVEEAQASYVDPCRPGDRIIA